MQGRSPRWSMVHCSAWTAGHNRTHEDEVKSELLRVRTNNYNDETPQRFRQPATSKSPARIKRMPRSSRSDTGSAKNTPPNRGSRQKQAPQRGRRGTNGVKLKIQTHKIANPA